MVTAFVGDDPNAGADTALDDPVEWPGQVGEGVGKEVEVRGGNVVEESGKEEVVNDVGKGADKGALEAMGRDGFLDLA